MRVLFFGTSAFAVPLLAALAASRHTVVGVVTQPDRPSGRGLQMVASPVKKAAIEVLPGVPVIQPQKSRGARFLSEVAAHSPDVLVVAAFGQILSRSLLELPPYGGVNVHGSLLPRFRGAAPIQYALMEGDPLTGVTTMQMDAGLDTGDILLQAQVAIAQDDTEQMLEAKLATVGAPLLLETLERLERADCPRRPQDQELATIAPSLAPDIGFIDWNLPSARIANILRGVTPRPGAFAFWNGKRIKIWAARACHEPVDAQPGAVSAVTREGIIVATGGNQALILLEVQPESKARMGAAEWGRGAHVSIGMRFDKASRSPLP
jgi:methionyl-tRNA formyltransferase